MENIRTWLAPTSSDPEIAQRQYMLNIILIGLAIPGTLFGILMIIFWVRGDVPLPVALGVFAIIPFLYLAYRLGIVGNLGIASIIPVTLLFVVLTIFLFLMGLGHISTVGYAIVVTVAAILIGSGAATAFLALSVIAYASAGVAQNAGLLPFAVPPTATLIPDTASLALALTVVLIINLLANREIARALAQQRDVAAELDRRRAELEAEVSSYTIGLERRAVRLETTAEIAQIAAEATDPEILMSQAIELIRGRFGFYHASIFILDETGTWAELAASTGEVGRKMLARRHRLAVGSASIVGWVASNRLPRVALDVEQDPYHFKNPLLPDTRSEMAVPLIIGQRLIGALDVQSTEPNAFDEDDIRTFEAIAGELTISIDSSRVQQEMRMQLEQFESESRAQVRESWGRLLQAGIPTMIHLDSGGELAAPPDQPLLIIDQSRLQGETTISEDRHEIAVPVRLRGETIATIAATRSPVEDPWNEEEIALIEAVAGQAALALENARQRAEEVRRLQELEVLNRVSQAVSQMLRLDTLFRVVHRQINQVVGDTDLTIALYDPSNDEISIPYSSIGGEPLRQESFPVGNDLTSVVIRSRQPLLLGETAEQQAALFGVGDLGVQAQSWLGVPMMIGDEILGVITVQDPGRPNRYTEEDAALLTTIASQIAAGIQNAQLLDQVQRAARRERLIYEITSKVRRSPDLKSIMETTSRELGRAFNAARASIRLGLGPEEGEGQPSDGGDRQGGIPLDGGEGS